MFNTIRTRTFGKLTVSIVQNLKNGYYFCEIDNQIFKSTVLLEESITWYKEMQNKILLATKLKQKRASRKPKVTLIHS